MAETEYTRRDIESVAEKEWGRIDIVEAGGGGSGDFEYCTVTVQSTMSGSFDISIPFIIDEEGNEGIFSHISLPDSTPHTLKVPLYKGLAVGKYGGDPDKISTSGNVTFYASAGSIGITGDGTITISDGGDK